MEAPPAPVKARGIFPVNPPLLPQAHHLLLLLKDVALDLSPDGGKLDARFAVGCALLALMKETAREPS